MPRIALDAVALDVYSLPPAMFCPPGTWSFNDRLIIAGLEGQ